jgi:hypothetical protein
MNDDELQDEIESELEEVPQAEEPVEANVFAKAAEVPNKDFAFYELVNEVLRGEWGTGQDRRRRLSEAGHDHVAVQKEIVRRLNNK